MKVQVNGRWIHTECKTLSQLAKGYAQGRELVSIYNGFQTNGDAVLSEQDSIFLVPKGTMPDKEGLEAMMAARHTPNIHCKVKKARVAIAGLGGLGSNVAVMLARTGVGRLMLVDFDVVEPSNLNRQSYYVRHLGKPKTEALKEQLVEINPYIDIRTKQVKVDEANIKELFSGYDIVCEAFDNPEAKAVLVNGILEGLPKTRLVAASGMAGYDSSNQIKTEKKMKNLYLCGDFESGAKAGNGLMAPRVQICAGHQANMILRLILGITKA